MTPVTPSSVCDMQDMVSKALRRAWQLGQTYWQQADSESYSQNKKADETSNKFNMLVDETRAALAERTQQEALTDEQIDAIWQEVCTDARGVRYRNFARALLARPTSAANSTAQPSVLPDGWVPLTIAWDADYPEEVAYGPQIMMDRLKKWLDKFYALRLAAPTQAPAQPSDDMNPIKEGWQLSFSADGHSGPGVYAHMDEYPEEGAVLVLALAAPTQAPMQPSDEQIDAVTSRVLGLELRRDLARVFARAVLALAAPTQAPMQPSVTRSTVIEWLDALNIEVTYKQLDGLFAAPTQAAPAAQPCKHGIRPAVDCSICLLPIAAAPAAAGSWDEHMQAMDKGWIYSASLRLADEVAGSTNVRIYAQGLAVKASEHARNIRAYLAAPAAAVEPDVSGWDPDQDVWHGDKPAAAAPEGLTFTLTADDAELLQGWISNVPVAEGSEVWQMLDRLHIALESPAAVEPKP